MDRKKRLEALRSPSSNNEKNSIIPAQLTKNWATIGFFDASPTYESIRPDPSPEIRNRQAEPPLSPKSKPRAFHRLSSLDSDDPNVVIEIGDVFEQIRRKHIRNGTRLLYQVIEIFPHSKSALVQSVYGKEKKTFKELLDTTEYLLVVTDKAHSTKKIFQAQSSLRDPLLRDKVKYSGHEGRDSLFSLFRQAPDDFQMMRPKDPLASPRPITPRLTYVLECRRQHIPPIPLLTRCFHESYPVLDLSNQSIGARYILPLAQSLAEMKFLKEINLTNNRLDSKSVLILMRGLVGSSLESVILDENKIGKIGIKAIQSLISGEWGEFVHLSSDMSSASSASSACSSPSSASSVMSNPSSPIPSLALPFSPIQKSRHPSIQSSSDFSISSSQSSLSSSFTLLKVSAGPLESHTPLAIRKLSLKSCSLGDNLISKLIQSLELHCLTLRSLNLSSNSCSSFTITSLSQLLASNVVPLESLDLSWNHLGTDQASTLLRSLSSNSTLKYLYLDYNGINQGILSAIATTGGMKISGEEFLESLTTSGGGDGRNGIVQLPSNQTIELISLANNSISNQLLKQYQQNFLTDLKLFQETKSVIL
jgi:hypothetical protein